MSIADFDNLAIEEKKRLLAECCNSTSWIKKMIGIFPVQDLVDLLEYAEEEWYECNPAEWLEAFQNHIKIGDIPSIEKNTTINADWVKNEQSLFINASPEILKSLAKDNELYEETFGYNFIVFTKGKSMNEIIADLSTRLENDPRDELRIAAGEQNKITQMRLQQLFS
ncbi:MAG: 2-oxo-4-hydroxy-4-carboxy-5-ureidoimidazoline decarboxylase [Ginsengibacter sp.]